MVATSWPDRPEASVSKRTEVVTFLICYSRWKQAVTYTCSRVPVMCGRTGDYMYHTMCRQGVMMMRWKTLSGQQCDQQTTQSVALHGQPLLVDNNHPCPS